MDLNLNSSIEKVKGIGKNYLKFFNENSIYRVKDLLNLFPYFYIDTSKPSFDLEKQGVFDLRITDMRKVFVRRKRNQLIIVNGIINKIKVKMVFFNRTYIFNLIKSKKSIKIYTKFEKVNAIYQSTNPLIINNEENRIFTVYKDFHSIKSGKLKNIIKNALNSLIKTKEYLPEFVINNHSLLDLKNSYLKIHLPQRTEDVQIGKKRLIYEEFLFFNLNLQTIRKIFKSRQRKNHYLINKELINKINSKLSFKLTEDQIKAFEDIVNDLKSNKVMNRLIQGDVGSGKTIIAFLSILIAIFNNYQSAFLVPTEVLAYQHFESAKDFFDEFKVEILTGNHTKKQKDRIYKKLKQGEIDLLIGTHSLLNDKLKFKNLSLIVIDEQHRFGVYQKAKLYYKSTSIDTLITTATPIPRTMLLSLYNDIDTSIIKTMPKNRKPIITKIISADKRIEFYQKIKQKIYKNKAYIVLPLINKSDFFTSTKSIESETDFYKKIFKDFNLGFIKGDDKSDYKSSIIKDFKDNKINLLISTSVIEVGIDVKDASMIIIEDADRFGLAQLHQLRGRVGRGYIQSYCYLIESTNISENGKKRLKAMKENSNGFKISEIDLKLRGGGIIAGLEQKGFLDFRFSLPQENIDLFKKSQKDAQLLINKNEFRTQELNNYIKEIESKSKNIIFG